MVVLSYVCSQITQFDAGQIKRIRQWFWRSAFSERYRVGGEGFVTKDLEQVTQFVVTGGDAKYFGDPLSAAQIAQTAFRSNNSRSRAFILALAAAKPRNLTNGALIDTSEALSQFNKKQFHHIYPRAYLKRLAVTSDDNVLANICMLAASENNFVSDSDPHEYIPTMMKDRGGEANSVLSSNFMPPMTAFEYSKATFEEFTARRSEILADFMSELCDGVAHP